MDESTKGKSKPRIILWLGILSSFLTVGLTGWNYSINRDINLKAQELSEQQFEVDKLRFVYDVLLDLSSKPEEDYIVAVNLTKITLGSDLANQLFEGLKLSSNKSISNFARIGVESVQLEEYAALIKKINNSDREIRITSTEQLLNKYKNSTPAIEQTLSLFSEPQIENLTANGRVNALVFLAGTDNEAWTAKQVKGAEEVIKFLESRDVSGEAKIGPTTKKWIGKLRAKILVVSTTLVK